MCKGSRSQKHGRTTDDNIYDDGDDDNNVDDFDDNKDFTWM